MEVKKRILFLGSLIFILFLSNCCDKPAPCYGFDEEPILHFSNDSIKFRVVFKNRNGIGDTTPMSNVSKIPIDMNSTSMSYTFLAPEDKGTLKLNYTVAMETKSCNCNYKDIINLMTLKNVSLDSASTFKNVYNKFYPGLRIDSTENQYYPEGQYNYYKVIF